MIIFLLAELEKYAKRKTIWKNQLRFIQGPYNIVLNTQQFLYALALTYIIAQIILGTNIHK